MQASTQIQVVGSIGPQVQIRWLMVTLMGLFGIEAAATQKSVSCDHGWPSICSPQSTLLGCASPTGKMVIVVKVVKATTVVQVSIAG
jgi:hypothetical protein